MPASDAAVIDAQCEGISNPLPKSPPGPLTTASRPWTDRDLQPLLELRIPGLNYEEIGQQLSCPAGECREQASTVIELMKSDTQRWTPSEDYLLVALPSHSNWELIAKQTGRSQLACGVHWAISYTDVQSKTHQKASRSSSDILWTPEEDKLLQYLQWHGNNWFCVAERVDNQRHSPKDCLDRWMTMKPRATYPFMTAPNTSWTGKEAATLWDLRRA